MLMLFANIFNIVHRFPRYPRDDFHRFRFPNDLPQALRLQCNGIKSVCGCTLHSVGDSDAWLLRNGAWCNQVSLKAFRVWRFSAVKIPSIDEPINVPISLSRAFVNNQIIAEESRRC